MNIIDGLHLVFFDVEVFKHGWVVCFEDELGERKHVLSRKDGDFTPNQQLKELLERLQNRPDDHSVISGFNNKWYDNHILNAIINNKTHAEIKALNDYIVEDGEYGWTWDGFGAYSYFNYTHTDTRDDISQKLGLKVIEGNMGMDITECEVPFDLDRPLTDEEWESVIDYCYKDVSATKKFFLENRVSYLRTKVELGQMAGVSIHKSVTSTNAKLVAYYLCGEDAQPVIRGDDTEYVKPDTIVNTIPEVVEFFDNIDPNYENELAIDIDGVPHVIGYGGIHGAKSKTYYESDDEYIVILADADQFYPTMITKYNYLSRTAKNPALYQKSVDERSYYKSKGDTEKQAPRKLVNNTTYGGQKAPHNALYDPLMANSICATGQMLLIDLILSINHLEGYELVQSNTDGVAFKIKRTELDKMYDILDEWQQRTRIKLDYDIINRIYQKDVNNYMMIDDKGKVKVKGGYIKAYKGRTYEDGNMVIVHKAIVDYLLYDIDPYDTIYNHDDILDFQMITNRGSTYKYTVVKDKDGNEEYVNKVNRVYASKKKNGKMIYKRKVLEDGSFKDDKIALTPDNVIIDNNNMSKLIDIDREFYYNLAVKRIFEFTGKDKHKSMTLLGKIAKGKTYLQNKDGVCEVFEKDSVIPPEWKDAKKIVRKVYLKYIEENEQPKEVEEEKEMEEIKVNKNDVVEVDEEFKEVTELVKNTQTTVTLSDDKLEMSNVDIINPRVLFYQKRSAMRNILQSMSWNKDGVNTYQEYEYITDSQVKDRVNEALIKSGLELEFKVVSVENLGQATGGKQSLYRTNMIATLIDIDTGYSVDYDFVGDGADSGDKGVYKAYTGAYKYFIFNNFGINTEQRDPENDSQDNQKEVAKEEPKKKTHVGKSKQQDIKEEIMSSDEPADEALVQTIRDYVVKLGNHGGYTDLIEETVEKMKDKPNQNEAVAIMMELEEVLDSL